MARSSRQTRFASALGRALALAAVFLSFAVASAGAAAGKGPAAGQYAGTTTETGAITFTVAKNGKAVQAFKVSLGYDGKCGPGGGPTFDLAVKSIALSATGAFHTSVTAHDNATAGVVTVTGTVSKSGARGTILEPKPFFACRAPNQKINPYSETFTAKRR